jgi:hypothetical protein
MLVIKKHLIVGMGNVKKLQKAQGNNADTAYQIQEIHIAGSTDKKLFTNK